MSVRNRRPRNLPADGPVGGTRVANLTAFATIEPVTPNPRFALFDIYYHGFVYPGGPRLVCAGQGSLRSAQSTKFATALFTQGPIIAILGRQETRLNDPFRAEGWHEGSRGRSRDATGHVRRRVRGGTRPVGRLTAAARPFAGSRWLGPGNGRPGWSLPRTLPYSAQRPAMGFPMFAIEVLARRMSSPRCG